MEQYRDMGGTICFKVKTLADIYHICDWLMSLNYCACFGHGNLYQMDYVQTPKGKNAIILTYDTESG